MSVASFDSGSRNRTAWFDYLNLLYFPLKRIEFLVAQVVMPHCEEHLYHSARQGLSLNFTQRLKKKIHSQSWRR